jgi:hypothetical protein
MGRAAACRLPLQIPLAQALHIDWCATERNVPANGGSAHQDNDVYPDMNPFMWG